MRSRFGRAFTVDCVDRIMAVLGISVQELSHPVREVLAGPLRSLNPPGLVGAAGSDMQKGRGLFVSVLRGVLVVLGGSHKKPGLVTHAASCKAIAGIDASLITTA